MNDNTTNKDPSAELEHLLSQAQPLPLAFYRRGAEVVAPELLGKILVTRRDGVMTAVRLVEVEAYLGSKDPASHAFRGMTERNKSMFKEGGCCYVYLSYGLHSCLNVVTGKGGEGKAVLLRAGEPLLHSEVMLARRGLPSSGKVPPAVTNGPGKLCAALGLGLHDNGLALNTPDFKLVDGALLGFAPSSVATSPRIGITKAADLPLRFYFPESRFVGYRSLFSDARKP